MAHHDPYHPADGQAGDPLHDPAGFRQCDGFLPGSALSGSHDALHKIRLDELQVYRRSFDPRDHHDDLRRRDHAFKPAEPDQPQELHDGHRQVRPDLQDPSGPRRPLHHSAGARIPDILHKYFPDRLLRLRDLPAQPGRLLIPLYRRFLEPDHQVVGDRGKYHRERHVRPDGYSLQQDDLERLQGNASGLCCVLAPGRHHRHAGRLRGLQEPPRQVDQLREQRRVPAVPHALDCGRRRLLHSVLE